MPRIIVVIIFCLVSSFSWAQQSAPAESGGGSTAADNYGPKRQIATIVYMGLGGAVLGLSTLSFYGRPQDKLTNIAIGFGIGVIIGTVYMTYQAATNPQEFYRSDYRYQYQPYEGDEEISTAQLFAPNEKAPMGATMTWSF